METAKLFENGKSQAVRLPKKYRFEGSEVFVRKVGAAVMLFPKQQAWQVFLSGLNGFTDDMFSEGRETETMTRRESLRPICWIRIFAFMQSKINRSGY